MVQNEPFTVLVAPLDWGLGHATRCIPIIKEFLKKGTQVIIASSGNQLKLLKQEFPDQECLEIPGYEITYGGTSFLRWGLLLQIPALLKKIKKERLWLKKTLNRLKPDLVVSDNRFGLHNNDIHCIFITHQLNILTGLGKTMDRLLMKWNYHFIKKFSVCWIPDEENQQTIAGKLSHPDRLPSVPVKYIGILTRFRRSSVVPATDSVLILISGPEPQRTQFEKTIFKQLSASSRPATILRGLPGDKNPIPPLRKGLSVYNHLPSMEINRLINESEIIVARSGYSTIMDLLFLNKKAILIPTPGQTEQEYLAKWIEENKWAKVSTQSEFNLEEDIKCLKESSWLKPELNEGKLGCAVEKAIQDSLLHKKSSFRPEK